MEFAVAVCCLPEDFFSGFFSKPAEFLTDSANRPQAHWVVGVVDAANKDEAYAKAFDAFDQGLFAGRKPGDGLTNWFVAPLDTPSDGRWQVTQLKCCIGCGIWGQDVPDERR